MADRADNLCAPIGRQTGIRVDKDKNLLTREGQRTLIHLLCASALRNQHLRAQFARPLKAPIGALGIHDDNAHPDPLQ